MKILVTGVNGFVGKHLAREITGQGHMVIGTGTEKTLTPKLREVVSEYFGECDLTSRTSVKKLPINDIEAVINLAGIAQVGTSFGKDSLYTAVNVQVHTVLIEELIEQGSQARVIAVSTGAVYDNHQSMPLNEASKLILRGSPYALSKIAMEKAVSELDGHGPSIVIVRPFNHIGPGQLPGFLIPDLAHQVLKSKTIRVGNLITQRDYADVRDVVKAYVLLATTPSLKYRVYNICSGKSLSGNTILQKIITASGKKDTKTVVDQQLIRPNDPLIVIGDNTRINTELGWKPTISFEQTISDYIKSMA